MRLSTALRVAGIIVVAKAFLIGVVYWGRAEILGRPVDLGVIGWIAVVATAVLVVVAGVAIVTRHFGGR